MVAVPTPCPLSVSVAGRARWGASRPSNARSRRAERAAGLRPCYVGPREMTRVRAAIESLATMSPGLTSTVRHPREALSRVSNAALSPVPTTTTSKDSAAARVRARDRTVESLSTTRLYPQPLPAQTVGNSVPNCPTRNNQGWTAARTRETISSCLGRQSPHLAQHPGE